MKTDGKFIIQSGDGITQGIQKELGLSDQECKQLGSVWTQIINEFDGQTDGQNNMTVTNNNGKNADKTNNYFVYANAVVEFSKASWQKIVSWVNQALGKNITVDNQEESEINPTNGPRECADKAMSLIKLNVNNLKLPQGIDATQFANNLQEAYAEQIADLPGNTTVADMIQSILTTAFCKGKNLNDAEMIDMQKIALRNAAQLAPDDSICGVKCSEILENEELAFSKLYNTQAPVPDRAEPLQNATIPERIASLRNTPSVNEVEPPPELKQNVDRAINYLTNQLNNLTSDELQQMGISEAKRDRILEYLKNITYAEDHDSAQAKGGGIVFSIHCKDTDNLANMVTLLMHEANHCDENYLDTYPEDSEPGDLRHRTSDGQPRRNNRINTKEEERACETLGLLTTAVLINKGVLTGQDDYGRYGNPPHPVTSYLTDKNLLKSDIDYWVSNYTNYPEGINNAGITVEHLKNPLANVPESILNNQVPIKLEKGDIIKVGDQLYTLGGDDGFVLTPWDSIPIFQMIKQGNVNNGVEATIVFDELSPCKEEIEFFDMQNGSRGDAQNLLARTDYEIVEVYRNGQKICTGKIYR